MSKKDWIISYIYIFLTIAVFFASFKYTGIGSLGKTVIVCACLLMPILCNFSKNKKDITYTFGNRISIFCGIYFFLFLALFMGFSNCSYESYVIAITPSAEKANEIQSILTTQKLPTIREVITNADGKEEYAISYKKSRVSEKFYTDAIIKLLNSSVIDDSVVFPSHIQPTKNIKKYEKRIEDEKWRVVSELEHINDIYLGLYLEPDNEHLTVHYELDNGVDKNVHKKIERFIYSSFPNIKKEKILFINEIEAKQAFNKYKEAQKEYKKNNYDLALKLFKEADNIQPGHYSNEIKLLSSFIKNNELIKRNAANYKTYIEMGDFYNKFFKGLFEVDDESAIKYYTKALELNPKAYEVYERRGDVYSDDAHAIEDYLKAIKYAGGNNKLYYMLGIIYKSSDIKEALTYFNKIKQPYPKPINCGEYKNDFKWVSFCYAPVEKILCYDKLGQYDKVLETTNEILKTETYKPLIKQTNDMEFYYNWKAGHYMTALKSADNCSTWVCKLAGIFF